MCNEIISSEIHLASDKPIFASIRWQQGANDNKN